ncbi:MAG: hypothetical protein ABI672_18650 [Vicinamibacteria bacterium]
MTSLHRSFILATNVAVALAFTLLLAGCGKAPPKEAAPAAAAPAEEEAAATPAVGAVAITAFGVPECDKYVKQFLGCVEGHVTGEQKDKMMEAFDANRVKWRAMASMREGAIALSVACRAAAQKSKDELTVDYGCEF